MRHDIPLTRHRTGRASDDTANLDADFVVRLVHFAAHVRAFGRAIQLSRFSSEPFPFGV